MPDCFGRALHQGAEFLKDVGRGEAVGLQHQFAFHILNFVERRPSAYSELYCWANHVCSIGSLVSTVMPTPYP